MFYLLDDWSRMSGDINKYPYDKACYFCFKLYDNEVDKNIISLSTVLRKYN